MLRALLGAAVATAAALPENYGMPLYLEPGDNLARVVALEKHEPLFAHGPQRSGFYQALATERAFVGDVFGALLAGDRAGYPTFPAEKPALRPVPGDAAAATAGLAAGRRVVMINEAHHVPATRMLTRRLLPLLRAQGFTHFAAEGFSPSDPGLPARGYPVSRSGYYLAEPVFGELAREAIALGFQLVAYEPRYDRADAGLTVEARIAKREIGQAENLRAGALADPAARVFVHLGYAHLDERTGGRNTWMAARLKAMMGIDPLTIDQTILREHGDPRFEDPRYAGLLAAVRPAGPRLLAGDPGIGADYAVLSPRTTWREKRPAWLFAMPGRRAVKPPASFFPAAAGFPLVARAFRHGETGDRIPADQYLLDHAGWLSPFVLGPGAYDAELADAEGHVLAAGPLEVR